jgi:hypothetical protein
MFVPLVGSDTPEIISILPKLDGWFVTIRSKMFVPLVGSDNRLAFVEQRLAQEYLNQLEVQTS